MTKKDWERIFTLLEIALEDTCDGRYLSFYEDGGAYSKGMVRAVHNLRKYVGKKEAE